MVDYRPGADISEVCDLYSAQFLLLIQVGQPYNLRGHVRETVFNNYLPKVRVLKARIDVDGRVSIFL